MRRRFDYDPSTVTLAAYLLALAGLTAACSAPPGGDAATDGARSDAVTADRVTPMDGGGTDAPTPPSDTPTPPSDSPAPPLDAPAPPTDTPSPPPDAPTPPPPDGGPGACAYPRAITDGFTPTRVLYVAPGGNDTRDGLSAATAWATIAHASALRAGDEVRVARGTYGCAALASIRGTAAAPVRFVSADGPRAAVFDCGGRGGMLLTNLQYVAFEGFEIRNGLMGGHCLNLNSGGAPYTNLSEHVLFRGVYVHNCDLSAIKTSQAFAIDIRESELTDASHVAGNPGIDWVAVHDSVILANDIHDVNSIGIQVKGGAYDVLVEGNRLHDLADHGINLGQSTGTAFYLPGYTDWEARRASAVNNLFYGRMRATVAVAGCDGCVVANNSAFLAAPNFYVRGLATQNQAGATIGVVNLVLQNNIFASNMRPTVVLNLVPAAVMGLMQGHNLYYAAAGSVMGVYSDTPIGGPGNLIDVDPQYASRTTPDLHLAAGSRARGAGVVLSPAITRAYGPACRAGMDMGAY